MDIKAASMSAVVMSQQSGRSGSAESAAQARKAADDSHIERKEAEAASQSRDSRRVDIRA
jgi:hypothetical protein